jgi:hypothetical protein
VKWTGGLDFVCDFVCVFCALGCGWSGDYPLGEGRRLLCLFSFCCFLLFSTPWVKKEGLGTDMGYGYLRAYHHMGRGWRGAWSIFVVGEEYLQAMPTSASGEFGSKERVQAMLMESVLVG